MCGYSESTPSHTHTHNPSTSPATTNTATTSARTNRNLRATVTNLMGDARRAIGGDFEDAPVPGFQEDGDDIDGPLSPEEVGLLIEAHAKLESALAIVLQGESPEALVQAEA